MGFALYLGLWVLLTSLSMRGDSQPLPYIPLLNPLDLAQVFVMIVLLRYFLLIRADLLARARTCRSAWRCWVSLR